ncbi:DUF3500 domain-containing protein [Muriicola sp. Z0-33]|uniref:DUF3500 domain-containing protein n=1 Tax=Muriicola sp. Z0-33 TaxID=2816957 RepID=UPI0022389C74|nr:DUF3500 domain-containing protein [Muriicola sp. Z0-33]MCW5516705.1 DUF3500 domain-containing protein [Muriicola sp. Z0-33]
MKKTYLLLLLVLVFGCKQKTAEAQVIINEAAQTEDNPVKARFAKMEADALKKDYDGIFTDDGKLSDLFPIKASGVSTSGIQKAATAFLASLDANQRKRIKFEIDDVEWRKWSNVDNGIYERQGVSLMEMTANQKKAAFHLMQEALSAKGLQLSKDIMKTDQTLKEINNGSDDYDEELYFFTLMGTPSETQPWGWQLDGHHLIINYFILGDQIVMSPVFMGGEPIITTSGKYKGNTIFQDEQNVGLAFMQSLSEEQQKKAILDSSKAHNNNVAAANKDNLILNYEGLQLSEMTSDQQEELTKLIAMYVNNIREGHQQIRMEEVLQHLDHTWFAWVGHTDEDAVFYYRIHSPVILIEFDHQRAVGVPSEVSGATRNHIHTMLRTPNGNDYGKDLLRQHLEKAHK